MLVVGACPIIGMVSNVSTGARERNTAAGPRDNRIDGGLAGEYVGLRRPEFGPEPLQDGRLGGPHLLVACGVERDGVGVVSPAAQGVGELDLSGRGS